MKAVFRVDSSDFIGFGHLVRCLTLARELRERNFECSFICRDHRGNISATILENNFELITLPVVNDGSRSTHTKRRIDSWLGCAWEKDRDQTRERLASIKPDWLIVDHYSIGAQWEMGQKGSYRKLMVIDDLANRNHACDLLLDQNLFENQNTRYDGLVPTECLQLLGPKYALLQAEYLRLRQSAVPKKFKDNRLLIFFGGADQNNLTKLAFLASQYFPTEFSAVNVVLPSQSPHYKEIRDLVGYAKNAEMFCDLPSLAQLISDATMGIGAGGATHWERLCLGLPSIVVTSAENQRRVNASLNRLKLIKHIGDGAALSVDHFISAIKSMLARGDMEEWSQRCMKECWGNGAISVADAMHRLVAR